VIIPFCKNPSIHKFMITSMTVRIYVRMTGKRRDLETDRNKAEKTQV
jgi:hypothetical protein